MVIKLSLNQYCLQRHLKEKLIASVFSSSINFRATSGEINTKVPSPYIVLCREILGFLRGFLARSANRITANHSQISLLKSGKLKMEGRKLRWVSWHSTPRVGNA